MSDFEVIELSPYARRTHHYTSSEDVADCQGAEIYVGELMYEYPLIEELNEIHASIRDQGGVYDGTCVELAERAEEVVQRIVDKVDAVFAQGPSCPIRSFMYGGIPSGGGFGSNTEWEIGAQRAAEAAHCILGSLGKNVYGRQKDFDWNKTLQAEEGHIKEEMEIITWGMKEYAEPVYTNRMNRRTDYDPDGVYAEYSIESVRKAGPELAKLANKRKSEWLRERDVPKKVHALGTMAYSFLAELGNAMAKATVGWPDKPIQNPYKDPKLVRAAKMLKWAVDDAYEGFERVHLPTKHVQPASEPEPVLPRPLTEKEKEALERQPDEEQVDYIMRLLGSVNGMMLVNWEDFASTPWKFEEEFSDVLECGEHYNVWPCGREGEIVATKTVKCREGHPVTFRLELEYKLLNRDLLHRPKPSGRLEYYEPDLELKILKLKEKVSTPVCLLPEDEDIEDCYPWNELVKHKQDFKEFVLEGLTEQLYSDPTLL